MKANGLFDTRTSSRIFVLAAAVFSLSLLGVARTYAQNPSSGTVGPASSGQTATWQQTAPGNPGGGANTEATCVDGVNCEVYTLTVSGTPTNWAKQRVQVQLNWTSSLNEYDIYIHKGTLTGPLVTSATAGPGLTNQTAFMVPATSGTGVFVVHVVFDTTPNVTDHYTGTASAAPLTPVPPPSAPQDTGPTIGYENFEAPGVLTPVVVTSSGGLTVEYEGRGAGEPSVGSDWNTGVANIQSDLETLFVTFDDNCSLTNPKASWVNRRAPTSQLIDSDPIGFTDRQTGRVFAAELTLLSPDTVKISHTDSDGVATTTEPTGWTPAMSGGPASAVDHETLGGGPYHLINGVAPPHSPTYPNAVYYCSQDLATALCSRSDDGGTTFGPSVPISNLTTCVSIHGHVKVSPVDGTVYVPQRQCGASQAVIVSQDNGVTWAIHPVQNATINAAPPTIGTGDDPAVGIDSNGRVYFAFSNASTAASVATSDDFGVTWQHIYNVGASFKINNVAFPAAVGGDPGRAAVAYYGSNSGTGDSNSSAFTGVWHLYVAHTFDGGAHWTTSDVTPTLPMQRSGILRGGTANIDRNLLDFFDITIDRDGRVLVGYVNGCSGGNCAEAAPTARGNTYSATATIARQSSGRRMLAAKDPTTTTSVPGMPFVTQRRVDGVVYLAWNEADTGNSTITGYQILRGTASGAETLLTTAKGTQKGGTFTDQKATDLTKTYYYKVVAVNGVGSSCGNNEVAAPYVGDPNIGTIIHQNEPTHPEATGGSAGNPPAPELLIDYIAVGEPPDTQDLMFKMKVGDLSTIPPNSRWRIAWDWFSPATEMYYIGMKADQNGAITFEYGTLADAGVPAILVLGETPIASCAAMSTSCTLPGASTASQYNTDGTITMFVPKSGVASPQAGDLLGAIGGKTITGDTPSTSTFERSTTFVDHTFIKGQADNCSPPATYTLAGNATVVTVTASPTQVHEGSGATYTITASVAPSQPLTVHYKMSGTASLGNGTLADYNLSGTVGQVTIPAGQTSATVTLSSNRDPDDGSEPKNGETAIMTLQAGGGVAVGTPGAATVNILP
jgi:hypothetical protein